MKLNANNLWIIFNKDTGSVWTFRSDDSEGIYTTKAEAEEALERLKLEIVTLNQWLKAEDYIVDNLSNCLSEISQISYNNGCNATDYANSMSSMNL